MTIEQLALTILGFLISIIAYFLKRIIEKQDNHDSSINQLKTSVRVIETEHNTFSNQFSDLFTAIKESNQESKASFKELGNEIKQLAKEVSKKKDIDK